MQRKVSGFHKNTKFIYTDKFVFFYKEPFQSIQHPIITKITIKYDYEQYQVCIFKARMYIWILKIKYKSLKVVYFAFIARKEYNI